MHNYLNRPGAAGVNSVEANMTEATSFDLDVHTAFELESCRDRSVSLHVVVVGELKLYSPEIDVTGSDNCGRRRFFSYSLPLHSIISPSHTGVLHFIT